MPDSLIMSTNIIYFQSSSRLTAHFIQSKQQCILNDMIGAVDQGHVGALMLPPLTPSTIKSSLSFYIGDSVCRGRPSIGWLTTLVVGVRSSGGSDSENSALHFGVPQGSVFGPKAFLNTLKTSHISWKACSITCSLMTCRAKSTEGQLMSYQSSQL